MPQSARHSENARVLDSTTEKLACYLGNKHRKDNKDPMYNQWQEFGQGWLPEEFGKKRGNVGDEILLNLGK